MTEEKTTGKCCYSSATDCDSSRDWCSKSSARCSTCGGNFSSAETSTRAGVTNLAAAAALAPQSVGKCCYYDATDCDRVHDWCSKSKERCSSCCGTFYTNESDAKALNKSQNNKAKVFVQQLAAISKAFPGMTGTGMNQTTSGRCCYASASDCDAPKDWCSKSETRCSRCQGTFYSETALASGSEATVSTAVAAAIGCFVGSMLMLLASRCRFSTKSDVEEPLINNAA
jgi:hypothetical protein